MSFTDKCVYNILYLLKTVLPLGEDPPAITSLCFNHNGKILAAAASDGMIHMFGILIFLVHFNLLLFMFPQIISHTCTNECP